MNKSTSYDSNISFQYNALEMTDTRSQIDTVAAFSIHNRLWSRSQFSQPTHCAPLILGYKQWYSCMPRSGVAAGCSDWYRLNHARLEQHLHTQHTPEYKTHQLTHVFLALTPLASILGFPVAFYLESCLVSLLLLPQAKVNQVRMLKVASLEA